MAPGRKASPTNYSLRQSRTCNRSAANERERKRMQSLSKAFTTLRAAIPWIPSDTKLSKLDTLTAAIEYISWLDDMVQLPNVHPEIHSSEDPIQSIAQQKKTWLSSVKTNNKWRRLNCKIVDRAVKKHHRSTSFNTSGVGNNSNSNNGNNNSNSGPPQVHHHSNSNPHSQHHHHHNHHHHHHHHPLLLHHRPHPHPHQSSEREVKHSIHESTCSSTHADDKSNFTCCTTSSTVCKSGDEEVATSDEGGSNSLHPGPWNQQDTW